MKEKNVLKMFSQIINDLQNQDLETVTELLNHYCENPIEEDGTTYQPFNGPKLAARINARYNELTGKDHPVFLKHQAKVIDELLADKEKLIKSGAYTPMYFDTIEQLKGNLTNDTPTMEVVNGSSKHVLGRMSSIVSDLENAQLEDVSELLNYYNGKPVLIDGVSYHPYNDPRLAARINARYNELTGEDHPTFLQEQGKVIDGLLADKKRLIEAGRYTPMYFDTLEQLKGNLTKDEPTMEVSNGYSKHILSRMDSIVNDLDNANLEDVSQLLDYYNGKPVLIDGVTHQPYKDPMIAAKLNARYNELTGENHSTFVEQSPKVIDGLMQDRDMLLQAGAYSEEYFEQLNQIRANLNSEHNIEQSGKIEQRHAIDRTVVIEATGDVKISDINNETGEIDQAVKAEQQPKVELDSQNVEPEK